jgi:hypothetical protein
MIAAAYWAGYLLARPEWLLIAAACVIVAAVFVLVVRMEDRRDDRGAHALAAGPRVVSRRPRPWQARTVLVSVPPVHHDEYAPEKTWTAGCGGTATPPATDSTAAPSPKDTRPSIAVAAAPSVSTRPGLPPGADSPAPEDVPGQDGKRPDSPATASGGQHYATTHATFPGEPEREHDLTGDEAPGPGLPEGDTHPVWPPQEAGPGGSYTDHLHALAAILAELSKPADEERWPHLVAGAGYSDETGSFERIVAEVA